MKPQKQTRLSSLEQLVKGLLAGVALYFSAGCGPLYQTSLESEMVRRKNNIVAPEDFDLDGRITKANRLLMRFPTVEQINQGVGIDVVKSVNKYLIPGASKLMVHGRQEHFVENLSEEGKKEVMAVQKEVYISSDYFRKNRHVRLRRAHNEGITSEYWAGEIISLWRFIDGLYRDAANDLKTDIKKLERKLMVSPSAERDLIKILEEKRRKLGRMQQNEGESFLYGAILKLGAEGKLRILPAEKPRRKEADLSKEEALYAITDGHENTFLEIASKQRGYIVYVVFGGGHAWGGKTSCGADYDLSGRISREDNIANWNAKHPDKKFSLIEITFRSYNEDKALMKKLQACLKDKN